MDPISVIVAIELDSILSFDPKFYQKSVGLWLVGTLLGEIFFHDGDVFL